MPFYISSPSSRTPSDSGDHQAAAFEERPLALLTAREFQPQHSTSTLWLVADGRGGTLPWISEGDVHRRAIEALEDCASSAGLGRDLHVGSDVTVTGQRRPHIAMVRHRSAPTVGMPMVIAPAPAPAAAPSARARGPSALNRSTLQGQIFDHMCMQRTHWGVRQVFGVVTNYLEWRVVWLPDSQTAADATELPFQQTDQADPLTPTR